VRVEIAALGPELLTARQVQLLLAVDRSTVYRLARDGRLPAVKVGRQWRFPAGRVRELMGAPPPPRPGAAPLTVPETVRSSAVTTLPVQAVRAVARAAGALLGVMVVVTDMEGRPLSEIVNPCPWFTARAHDPQTLVECIDEWRGFADDVELLPHFRLNNHGFECARALLRSGPNLVGMVLAGGVAPSASGQQGLDVLDDDGRRHVLTALARIAAILSETTTRRGAVGRGDAGE
jgi:excisionase family DNA binding protein